MCIRDRGISVRPSETLGTRLMYAAVRTQGGDYILSLIHILFSIALVLFCFIMLINSLLNVFLKKALR